MGFVDEAVETRPTEEVSEPGDHERFAHIVDKRFRDPEEALVFGLEVQALCGKRWVPTRDPKKFPVCPTCKGIWDEMDAYWKEQGR